MGDQEDFFEVTFLGNNKVHFTWYEYGGVLAFKQKGLQNQYYPTAEVISGSGGPISTSGLVSLVSGGGEMVLTYPSAVKLTAIGFNGAVSYYFDWMEAEGQAADAIFDTDSLYIWEAPQTTPLSTPTGLYADNITSDSARTNWQAVDNASNYKVQYKAAGDTVWTETYTD